MCSIYRTGDWSVRVLLGLLKCWTYSQWLWGSPYRHVRLVVYRLRRLLQSDTHILALFVNSGRHNFSFIKPRIQYRLSICVCPYRECEIFICMYYIHSNICSTFKSSTTLYWVIHNMNTQYNVIDDLTFSILERILNIPISFYV